MKVVTIPQDVRVSFPRKTAAGIEYVDEERGISVFLKQAVDSHQPFSKGHVNALTYQKLIKVIDGITPESAEIWFEDEDFKKLQEAIGTVEWITPAINAAYIPFYEAVKNARTEVNVKVTRPPALAALPHAPEPAEKK
jgi:hypothetical protein